MIEPQFFTTVQDQLKIINLVFFLIGRGAPEIKSLAIRIMFDELETLVEITHSLFQTFGLLLD